MQETDNTSEGKRRGPGRPRKLEKTKMITFRAGKALADILDAQEHRTEFIKAAIDSYVSHSEIERMSAMGEVYPATQVKDVNVRFFDIGMVAGFPVPLDNDEKGQSIELLRMLCPYPESSYLIRIEGNSMIDAGIKSGDIVIVDKSNRNPTATQIAVCELNGEYTLKHFQIRDGEGWLVPENPDFPEIKVSEQDSFSIWGTVTYVIHRPN